MTPWQRFVFTCIFQKQKEANELLTKSDHTCGKKNGTWNMANKEFLGKSLPIPQNRMSGFKLAKDIDCPVSAGNATWELLGKSADSRETRGGLINIKISTFDAKEAQGKSYIGSTFHFSLIWNFPPDSCSKLLFVVLNDSVRFGQSKKGGVYRKVRDKLSNGMPYWVKNNEGIWFKGRKKELIEI